MRNAYPSGVSIVREYVVADPHAGPDQPNVRLHVANLGMACCAVEFAAAVARGLLVPATTEAGPDVLHILVVSGTVTERLAPVVADTFASLPEPRAVLSFGACSNSGGPYWDSYSVTAGIDQWVPVASYVPGCPPRPEALIDALSALAVRS